MRADRFLCVACAALALAACKPEAAAELPAPTVMTEEAVGYYCQMNLFEHEGPKAQIHVAGMPQPLWFSQVRDAIAYTRLPEETDEVTAFYVSDMGRAESWADPGADNWVAAEQAYFVIESRQTGGMGAPEAVPFGDLAKAEAFAAEKGGRVVALAEIPDDYVLAPVDISSLATRPGEVAQ